MQGHTVKCPYCKEAFFPLDMDVQRAYNKLDDSTILLYVISCPHCLTLFKVIQNTYT